MTITDETLRLSNDLRIFLGAETSQAVREQVRAFALAWTELQREFTAAANEIVALVEDDQWPSPWQIARAQRAKDALAFARRRLAELAAAAGVDVIDRTGRVIDETPGWQSRILASQLPAGAAIAFDRVDPDAIEAIVRRSTQRITTLMGRLPAEVYQALRAALIRGVALGDNPNDVAARLVRELGRAWAHGLSRAIVIARTEMLDAHRAAALAHRKANADLLKGWRWTCSLSTRTCPACLSMHGRTFAADEPGPLGHPNCRCTAVPVTRSWRDLGIPIDEPPDVFPDARAWFDSLPETQRAAIMGRARLDAIDSGAIGWDDLASLRRNPGWRDSYAVTRLRDQHRAAA